MYKHWKLETDRDNLAWLSFDKAGASTNTLSADVMAELDRILDELRAGKPRALIIRSGKESGFIAGADIEEFTRIENADDVMRLVKRGWDLYNKLEALPFPTLALVDGYCMGGGVELALACRYRVAVDQPGTRFALPEVMLGILPAWGGVMRLPRLIGAAAALDMLMTGRAVDARRARRMGLVDAAVPPRIQENTARMMALEAPRPRKLSFMQALMNSAPMRPIVASMARKQLAARARREHYPAPYAILDLWQHHGGNPFAPRRCTPSSPRWRESNSRPGRGGSITRRLTRSWTCGSTTAATRSLRAGTIRLRSPGSSRATRQKTSFASFFSRSA
jgi:3-hydroxyacyl-CoA dehydrogenase/enoyl-CoA hydratase/3-hydroxybutyryl-CoA epimerase